MFVNKMGAEHLEFGKNCQDFGMVQGKRKLVCDGCSEGAHTEVGAKAFVHLTKQGYGIQEAFERLAELFGQQAADVRDYLCFTVLLLEEREEDYWLRFCGDGYVILENFKGELQFVELSDGKYPRYYAYNYVNRDSLSRYRDGVKLEERFFSKKHYRRAGVATDGIRFALKGEDPVCKAFAEALMSDREAGMKRLVNKYQRIFRDDVTIAW